MRTHLRYRYNDLLAFAEQLVTKAGLPSDRAATVAEILLEADLMGHTTHGLQMLPEMLMHIQKGLVRPTGEPRVIADHGASVVWDAECLPGTWLMAKAVDEACARALTHPVVTYAIRRSAHIVCLGAYLRRATDRGMVIWIMNGHPRSKNVAPAGSIEGQLAVNPLAFGYPTADDPVLIDFSTTPFSNGFVRRALAEGTKFPAAVVQDAEGNLTDDPKKLVGEPPGSMLPLGGREAGHKGFALGLMVEVLTSGLTGTGRANLEDTVYGTPVFLQVMNPEFFSGTAALKKEASALADACRASRPIPGQPAVRMPGDNAIASKARQLKDGVTLYPAIVPELVGWGKKLGVSVPAPI
jgi:L-lactate dehydrogenase